MTKEEFEARYAARNHVRVEDLPKLGLEARQVVCVQRRCCEAWQMVKLNESEKLDKWVGTIEKKNERL